MAVTGTTAATVASLIGAYVLAYLLGGIPWALIIGKRFFGLDLRTVGSGNLGATNTFRNLGYRAGIATLLLDAAKGALAVAAAQLIVGPAVHGELAYSWARVGAMMAAALGHSYSPYIRLRGGKGVATSAGALFVLTPLAASIELAIFIAIVWLTRFVSLGSVVIALVYPVLVYLLYPGDVALQIMIFVLAALIVIRHRGNLARILKGQESKIVFRRPTAGQQHTDAPDNDGGVR